MRFDILELTEIPREKDKLKAIIGTARYEQRKRQLIQIATYVILAIAIAMLALGACSHGTPIPHGHPIYLPLLGL